MGRTPSNITVQGNPEWFVNLAVDLKFFEIFNSLPRRLYLMKVCFSKRIEIKKRKHTLIAIVRTAAITSNDPPSTWLSYKSGSYSQMVVAFSTAAILVIWPITSTLVRLTICFRQLVDASNIIEITKPGAEPLTEVDFWLHSMVCTVFGCVEIR